MIYTIVYLLAIIAANLSVHFFGPVSLPINAFLFIGLDLTLRDRLHDVWKGTALRTKMSALILTGSVVSYLINPATAAIAIASAVAFGCAAVFDTTVYHLMRKKGFIARANTSNVAGALVDSVLFPTIAFGALMPSAIIAQFAAKCVGGAVWAYLIKKLNFVKPAIAAAVVVLGLFGSTEANAQSLIVSTHYDVARQAPIGSAVYALPVSKKVFMTGFVEAWYNPENAFPQGEVVLFSKHWISYALTSRLSVSTELEISRNMAGAWARFPEEIKFKPNTPYVIPKVGFSYRVK